MIGASSWILQDSSIARIMQTRPRSYGAQKDTQL